MVKKKWTKNAIELRGYNIYSDTKLKITYSDIPCKNLGDSILGDCCALNFHAIETINGKFH